MPFKQINDLPDNVKKPLRNFPHAQEIYREAFNNAWEQYKDPGERRGSADREEVAHRVAWSAVKKKYEKTSNGEWHSK